MTATRRLLAVLATAAVTATASASTAHAAPTASPTEPPPQEPTTSRLHGSARMDYPIASDHVQVTVDAGAEYGWSGYPDRSWGTFRIYHRTTDPQTGEPLVIWGEFAVDCLTTGGPVATVTGTLVRHSPDTPWHLGDRSGASFYVPRRGTARIGLAGLWEPPLSKCMAPAPDAEVIDGGYSLRDKTPAG